MLSRIVAALAAASMAASPCAAQMHEFNDTAAFRGGASVGAYVRLPLAREAGKPARAQIGLRVTAIRDHRDYLSPAGPVHQSDALDLRLTGTSKPVLLIAGRPASKLSKERLNLSTGATVGVVVGGAAVLLLLAVAAAGPGFPPCPIIDGSDDHCTD
jgi:hypothetical protein